MLQPPDGGAAEHVFWLVQGLSERGFEVELAAGADSAIAPRLSAAGVQVHTLPLVRSPGGADVAAARGLRALDRERRYALVHGHSAKAGALVRLSLSGRRRLLYTPHCFPFANAGLSSTQRAAYRAVEQALVPRSGALVAVCEWERGEAERALRGAAPLLRAIPNGVPSVAGAEPDPDLLAFRGDQPLAGSIGGLRPPKQPLVLVRAMAELERAGVPGRLAFVGDGPMRGAVAAEIERLGLGERVRWFPYGGEMGPHLAALDVFALSSASEALPLSVLEAMSCGLPVLASGVGGIPEAVAEGETGLLAAPGDAASFASGLRSLCADAALRERLGDRRARALRKPASASSGCSTAWPPCTAICSREAARGAANVAARAPLGGDRDQGSPGDPARDAREHRPLRAAAARADRGRRRPRRLAREPAADAGARYLRTEPGLTRQRNAGVRAAEGDVVVFLDDDVEVAPGLFAALARGYEDPGVIGATGVVVEESARRLVGKQSRLRRLLGRGSRGHDDPLRLPAPAARPERGVRCGVHAGLPDERPPRRGGAGGLRRGPAGLRAGRGRGLLLPALARRAPAPPPGRQRGAQEHRLPDHRPARLQPHGRR